MLKLDNIDVVLSLVDRKGNPSPAKLFLRIIEDSASAVAGNALEKAQTSKAKLPQPLVSKASDALTTTSDTLLNQQNLVTSFSSLMKMFEPLIKIGNEVAKVRSSAPFIGRSELIIYQKIHPYVNIAWNVLSAGMKVNSNSLFLSFSSCESIRSDGTSTASSECEDFRSRQRDGEDLLARGFRRRTEEQFCSSRYHGRNTEANDRMRVFHSRLYTTQLWR